MIGGNNFSPLALGIFVFGDRLVQNESVFRLLRGFQDQRWIGRGVLRRELFERREIAGVGDDDGEFFQLVEL